MLYPVWRNFFIYMYRGLGILSFYLIVTKYEIYKSRKCTPFGMKCSKSRWSLGLCPRPHWGSLQRSPDPLVVRGFLPSAIAASRLRRLQFFQLVRSMIKKVWPPHLFWHKSHTAHICINQLGTTSQSTSHQVSKSHIQLKHGHWGLPRKLCFGFLHCAINSHRSAKNKWI